MRRDLPSAFTYLWLLLPNLWKLDDIFSLIVPYEFPSVRHDTKLNLKKLWKAVIDHPHLLTWCIIKLAQVSTGQDVKWD
jgi:hypothetical protein